MGISSQLAASRLIQPGVCTSSTRPASPYEGQVIYETDTDKVLVYNGSAWYANWNLPWGYIDRATRTSAQTSISTEADLTGLSITFTAVANRRYQAIANLNPYGTSGESANIFFNVAGSNALKLRQTFAGTNLIMSMSLNHVFAPSAGSTTVKMRMSKESTNVVNNYADTDFVCSLTIFDVGPV